jgi:hypothetical protein
LGTSNAMNRKWVTYAALLVLMAAIGAGIGLLT